ncbi:unnamed protein product [Zymoseptoria tritici ST99CH_3D7]|uniref:Amino acid permease/ SLC12A domain-containing protein n=1 Tax=Zymoseptoria tritici (strain ST99CH_3D7) TaxID=1276538 RepID=A0A1X7RIW1_ZYMT9|nr:unnamed protein product [Zymoseptoria tritici ST99CH_3D7]
MGQHSVTGDDARLAALGIQQELKRNFSPLSMLGLAFAILNSWTALSTSLSLALPSGGPSAVIWGLVTAGVFNLCLATSLAEFLSAFPSAGGQYHWVHIIAWDSWKPLLSWITAWINTFGWMSLVATGGLLGSQIVIGIIFLFNTDYEPQRWHQFLIYTAYTVVALLVNVFGNRILPHVNKAAIFWTLSGFVVISITLLACASPNYSSGQFVYREFLNETGWPDGLAWMLGLLQGSLALTGFDAVAHMIEEIPNAVIEGPKIMIYCVLIGLGTGFVFLSVLLFVAGDITEVIASTAGPLNQILFNATNSLAGTVCLLIIPSICLLFATISIMTTSSRMTYAFARDGGLPFSRYFARVHPTLDVPLYALGLTFAVVMVFGCIFLGSSSAFNAIVSASVVSLGVSYGIPIAINCLRGRRMLPPTRAFILPEWFAWTINILGVAYVIVTTVLFVFPPALPVTGSNMNYCIVAFAIVCLISIVQWFVDGRKNYRGPKVDLDENVLVAVQTPELMRQISGGEETDLADSKKV